MAQLHLVREIEKDTSDLDCERMAQAEIPLSGLLLTYNGQPLFVIEPEETEDGVMINIIAHPELAWHNTMTHRVMGAEITYKQMRLDNGCCEQCGSKSKDVVCNNCKSKQLKVPNEKQNNP